MSDLGGSSTHVLKKDELGQCFQSILETQARIENIHNFWPLRNGGCYTACNLPTITNLIQFGTIHVMIFTTISKPINSPSFLQLQVRLQFLVFHKDPGVEWSVIYNFINTLFNLYYLFVCLFI